MKRHASMNRIFRLVWNQALNIWVAVSETSKGRGKAASGKKAGKSRTIALAAVSASSLLAPVWSFAAPVGAQVTAGAAQVSTAGSTTTINQSSANVSLTWKSFNIGSQETVNFAQPNASSIAVNRIQDVNGTSIFGKLNANGQVFLINPNGVLFGAGAQVNVGGLVASTLDVSDSQLNSASRTFSGTGNGSVVNQGTITAADGGYVALLGNSVSNQGVISARLGTVALGGASAATLTFAGNSLLSLKVDESTLNTLAENRQLVQANGGQVLMSAGAKDSLLASVVNNTGVVEARTVENRNGVITLLGGMAAGTTHVGGKLDASAPDGGNGGFIETSAAHVTFADDKLVTTMAAPGGNAGMWLIDPPDFTIAATGGDRTAAQIVADLQTTPVTILSSQGTVSGNGATGNINVNQAITWTTDNSLTLSALANVNVNSNIRAEGANAGLVLTAGTGGAGSVNVANGATVTMTGNAATLNITHTGGNLNITGGSTIDMLGTGPSLTIAGNPYVFISALGTDGQTGTPTLTGFGGYTGTRYFAIKSNIVASASSGFTNGFASQKNRATPYLGVFEGLGHTISGLVINRPTVNDVGLIGAIGAGALVQNITLSGATVAGQDVTGALVGNNIGGTVRNATLAATSTVSGRVATGGLVGWNQGGSIVNGRATAAVSGTGLYTGVLVGESNGTISGSASAGSATSSANDVGGLVGYNYGAGAIANSDSSASANGPTNIGGLVGLNDSTATISGGTASGNVSGTNIVGGFVGSNVSTAAAGIANATATGNVSGVDNVGGFAGLQVDGTMNNVRATGNVTGTGNSVGGLLGYNSFGTVAPSVTNSSSTGTVTGVVNVGGLVGQNSGNVTASNHTIGQVNGTSNAVGGLVGENLGGVILHSYNTAAVVNTIGAGTGGLVGFNESGTFAGRITESFSTGTVTSSGNFVGGLVGYMVDTGGQVNVITDSYSSTGTVTGTGSFGVGGLVGYSSAANSIIRSYASNPIVASGGGLVGGLLGGFAGGPPTVTTSYWNTQTTGQASAVNGGAFAGATGINNAQSVLQATYTGFNFTPVTGPWRIYDTFTTPFLRFFMTPLTITSTAGATAIYQGSAITDAARGVTYAVNGSAAPNFNAANEVSAGRLSAAPYANAVNVGTYTAATGIYSAGQFGYDITQVGAGTLSITPAPLVYTATPAASTVGTAPSGLTGTVTGFVAGETQGSATTGTLTWTTPATATSPAGAYAINGGGLTALNYLFSQAAGNATALTVTAAPTPPAPAPGPAPAPTPPAPAPVTLTAAQAALINNQLASVLRLQDSRSASLMEPGTNDVSSGIPRSSPAKFNPLDFTIVKPDERKDTLSRVAADGGMRLPADRLIPPGGESIPVSSSASGK